MIRPPDSVLWDGDAAGIAGWHANAASGSRAAVAAEPGDRGATLRLDFALVGHGAWAIARREIALALPSHYVVSARLRGDAGPVELQVKFVDPSGASVWWWRRRGFTPPRTVQRLTLHQASLALAWGPAGVRDPDRIGAVEIAVAAEHDVRGTLWIEDLRIETREALSEPPRVSAVRASSRVAGHEPEHAVDDDTSTSWRPDPDDRRPWIELDLGCIREWGGLTVDLAEDAAPAMRLLASDDRARWTPLVETPAGGDTRRWLETGEVESRYVRLELGGGARVLRVAVVPIELAASRARFAAAIAKSAPRGRFPRHLLDEQGYWAVVGADGDERKALLGEDGALEVDAEAFTVEPFLRVDGRLLTWADVERRVSLVDEVLPLPCVEWSAEAVRLRITAFACGEPGASTVVARYEIEARGAERSDGARSDGDAGRRDVRLLVAIRPFQVTPAWQGLNLAGGVAPIVRLTRTDARVRVNGTRDVVAVTRPDGFAATSFDAGMLTILETGVAATDRIEDPLGFAQGVFVFDLRLAPNTRATVSIAMPLFEQSPQPPSGLAPADADAWSAARLDATAAHWRARLAHVPIALPPSAAPFAATLQASIAWILVNREGPRIQPGARAYRRSWIRDGTLTGTALAEMGFGEEARAFLRWYAPHQLADGRVPCAVDRRGVDHAVEHDSHGELIWGTVETFRLTHDLAFLRALWPHVLRAADAIADLRSQRTAEEYRGRCCFGLLPESISHEGYAASPVHAYWDDFFAVRALADAADAALVLDDRAAAARLAALRDAMRGDLHASIACTIARHGLDFVPGSVELGDFDPTSTAIAFDPCGEAGRLPRAALERTFARYWEEFEARRDGRTAADAYTPYEMRNVVALLRLGWKERALALLTWLVDDQRPSAWRQWPEVARRDPRAPGFLGDLPHGWVASTYLRTVRRLLVDEGGEDALVLAAGVPEVWIREPPGVRVSGLPTRHGTLDFTICAAGECVRFTFGSPLAPPGGIVVESPLARPLRDAVVDGRVVAADDARRIRLRRLPAELLLRY